MEGPVVTLADPIVQCVKSRDPKAGAIFGVTLLVSLISSGGVSCFLHSNIEAIITGLGVLVIGMMTTIADASPGRPTAPSRG